MIRLRSVKPRKPRHERHEADFYPTPPSATEALFDAHPPPVWRLLDPCAGDGAILRVAKERGYDVSAVELRMAELMPLLRTCQPGAVVIGDWLEISHDKQALERLCGWPVPAIVCNPPFSIAREIVEACLDVGACYVAALLRINVEASGPWRSFWEAHPWTDRVVLWRRPSFTGHGTDMTNYFWAIWES